MESFGDNGCELKTPIYGQNAFQLAEYQCPAATLVIRLLTGLVFFAEGIKKFMFPADWGVGRFEKIGIIYPHLSAPFVGVVETVCGFLLIVGMG